jgi:hypothetical protein
MKTERKSDGVWTLRAAKDRFSEVVAAAEKRPQRIVRAARSGAPAKEFVLSVAGPKRRGARKETLADWLLANGGFLDERSARILDEVVSAPGTAKADPPDFG